LSLKLFDLKVALGLHLYSVWFYITFVLKGEIMNHRQWLKFKGVVFVVVLLGALCTASSAKVGEVSHVSKDGAILYVGGSGPGNYSKIQDAVDNASDGDTVFVFDDSAPYWENIAINVSICLIGEDRNTTSIEGGTHAVSLYANGITVSGFTIRNVGDSWNCCGFYVVSDDNNISGNTIADNLRMNGVFLDGGSYNTIYGNRIENNNYHGIRMEFATHNVIANNILVNNRGYGMYLWESTDNLFYGNTVKQSFWDGLMLGYTSMHNTFYHNNFIDNPENAFDPAGNNIWDNGSSGNYWSDYTGSDCNGDGIGDVPYQIPGNASRDVYPLMKPYGIQESTIAITITGGFGITVKVKNTGNEEITNVDWSICLQGGFLLLPGDRCHNGTLVSLAAGEEVVIQSADLLFGIGQMTVNVTAKDSTATSQGFLLLFFFILTSSEML
jgi:parallel beta-helix repeat protein